MFVGVLRLERSRGTERTRSRTLNTVLDGTEEETKPYVLHDVSFVQLDTQRSLWYH